MKFRKIFVKYNYLIQRRIFAAKEIILFVSKHINDNKQKANISKHLLYEYKTTVCFLFEMVDNGQPTYNLF